MIPEAVAVDWARARKLSNLAHRVLFAFADFADEQGKAWPSTAALAEAAHLGRAATFRGLEELQEEGILKRGEAVAGSHGVLVRRLTPAPPVYNRRRVKPHPSTTVDPTRLQAETGTRLQAWTRNSLSRTPSRNSPPSGAPAPPSPPSTRSLFEDDNGSAKTATVDAEVIPPERALVPVAAVAPVVRGGGWPARLAEAWKARGVMPPARFGTLKLAVQEHGVEVIERALGRYLAGTSHPSPSPQHFAGELRLWLPGGAGESDRDVRRSPFASAFKSFLEED